MEQEQKNDADVVTLEIDTDNLNEEQARMLSAFGLEPLEFDEIGDDIVFETLDDLLECERHEAEGFWIDWPAVRDAKLLMAHPESAGMVYPQKEREVRAQGKVKDGEDTPAVLVVKAAGLAAFSRTVKDWKLELQGQPIEFNKVNFMMMWRSRRFRTFVINKAMHFRLDPAALGDNSGKA